MRALVLGVVMGAAVCGGQLTAQAPAAPAGARATVRASELDRNPHDTGSAARRRLSGRSTASRAALRIKTIEVSPARLEMTVGDEWPLDERVSLTARDSSGQIVTGWAPSWSLAPGGDAAGASLQMEHLFAASPGSVTVNVEARVFNDSSAWRVARNPAVASVNVVIRPAVYARPARAPVTPIEVAQAFVAAIVAEAWPDAAALVDLEQFQSWLIQRLATRRRPSATFPTLEQFIANMARAGGDSMPRAEVERRYESLRRARLPENLDAALLSEFHGISPDLMGSLPTIDAAARWLEGGDPRALIRKAAVEMGCDARATRALVAGNMVRLKVIGAATVNETTAWAMVAIGPSLQWQVASERTPALLLLRRDATGKWRVEASGVNGWRGSVHYNASCARPPR